MNLYIWVMPKHGHSAPHTHIRSRTSDIDVSVSPIYIYMPKEICLFISSHKLLVQALVTNKSDVRTFQNGQGKFFNFIVNDKSGAIKITAFNKEVDTFFSLVEEGKVYRISNANTRVANTNYPRVNTYELLLKNDSIIKLCDDTGDIPMQQYKFVSISKLDEMDPTLKPTVDVIGVCRSAEKVLQITTEAGRNTSKREINLKV